MSSKMHRISCSWLELLALLAVEARSSAEPKYLRLMAEVGKRLASDVSEKGSAWLGSDKSQVPAWEVYLGTLLPEGDPVRARAFYWGDSVVLRAEAVELLLHLCELARNAAGIDEHSRREFADAVHGLPEALRHEGVQGHRRYARSFFGKKNERLFSPEPARTAEIVQVWIDSDHAALWRKVLGQW